MRNLDLEDAHKYLLEPLIVRFLLEFEIPDVVETLSELFYLKVIKIRDYKNGIQGRSFSIRSIIWGEDFAFRISS